jgi:hypothetical protein
MGVNGVDFQLKRKNFLAEAFLQQTSFFENSLQFLKM